MPDVHFELITEADIEQVRLWRNTPRIQGNMFHREHISPEQQKDWFNRLAQDKSQQQFVCHLDNKPIGVLNFTNISEQACEWGCYIGDEHIMPGFGLALAACALDFAFESLRVTTLNAQVMVSNSAPQKIHKLFKYKLNQHKSDSEVIYYQYNAQDWVVNRDLILTLLPKHLKIAIDGATFNKGKK